MEKKNIENYFNQFYSFLESNNLLYFFQNISSIHPFPSPISQKSFWEIFLHLFLNDFEKKFFRFGSPSFNQVVSQLCNMRDFTTAKGLDLNLDKTLLSVLIEQRKIALKKLILKFHPLSIQILDEKFYRKLETDANQALFFVAKDYQLEPWKVFQLFYHLGVKIYFSKITANHFFSVYLEKEQKITFETWLEHCQELEMKTSKENAFLLNLWGEFLLDSSLENSAFLSLGGTSFDFNRKKLFLSSEQQQVKNYLLSNQTAEISNQELFLFFSSFLQEQTTFETWEDLKQNYDKHFVSLNFESDSELQEVFLWRSFKEMGKRLAEPLSKQTIKIGKPSDIFASFKHLFENQDQECFYVILLNTQNIVIHTQMMGKGILDQVLIHNRDIFNFANKFKAKSIILAHNHPSGICTPSMPDKKLTENVKKAGEILGISVLDHVIFGKEEFFSFQEEGLL